MFSISLGPLSVQVSHLVALAALLVAVGVGKLNRHSQPSGIGDILSTMVWVGLLTARVAFVVTWWDLYRADLWSIANIRDGGFRLGPAWPRQVPSRSGTAGAARRGDSR